MKFRVLLAASVVAGLAFTALPASAATEQQAGKKVSFVLTQLSGPKVGKLEVYYAVVPVEDLEDAAAIQAASKLARARLPYKKAFTLKKGTCALMAVAEGARGVKLRLDVTVGRKVERRQKGKAPNNASCNV